MLLALVVALGSGVVSFLAPCTVPLLPAYAGVLSGSSSGVPADEQPRRLLVGSCLYVVGFAAVFVVLGLLAGSVGTAVHRAGGPVQRLGGALVLILAALMLLDARLGLLSRLPQQGAANRRARLAGSSAWWAPLLLGVVFGTAFTPCVGPFLGGVLALAATHGGALRGAALLATYAVGLGVPFVVAALAVASSPSLTRRLSRASRPVAVVGAVLLGVLGASLLVGVYGDVAGWFARVLPFPSV